MFWNKMVFFFSRWSVALSDNDIKMHIMRSIWNFCKYRKPFLLFMYENYVIVGFQLSSHFSLFSCPLSMLKKACCRRVTTARHQFNYIWNCHVSMKTLQSDSIVVVVDVVVVVFADDLLLTVFIFILYIVRMCMYNVYTMHIHFNSLLASLNSISMGNSLVYHDYGSSYIPKNKKWQQQKVMYTHTKSIYRS